MLDLTAAADVDGVHFDGVDLLLVAPHVDIDASDDDVKRLADKVQSRNLVIGTLAAPVWPPTGGGSAMGSPEERQRFLDQVRKGCRMARRFTRAGRAARRRRAYRLGGRPATWAQDPEANTDSDRRHVPRGLHDRRGSRRAAGGRGRDLLGRHARLEEDGPAAGAGGSEGRLGFHADMAHTLLVHAGLQRAGRPHPPARTWSWDDPDELDRALETSPRRCVRGRTTSTSPRTTRRSRARARTTRPAGTACPRTPTASSTSRSTPATGCATRTAS